MHNTATQKFGGYLKYFN